MGKLQKIGVGLGLDVGGTGLRAALVSSDGKIVSPFIDEKRERKTLTQIDRVLRSLIKLALEENLEVIHIGVGVAGLIDPTTGVLVTSPSMTEMEGINFGQELTSMTEIPVTLNNDANSAGFGEWKFGAGRGCQSCVALFVGTGVGGAIILDGHLLTGKDGVAGEVGHIILDVDGPLCPCGARGCLEQLGSGSAIVKTAIERIELGENTMLKERFLRDGHLSGEDIALAALGGDELSQSIYKTTGRWIGVGIATLANLLNMETVVLGGGVMAVSQLIVPSIMRAKDEYTMQVQKRRLRVLIGELGRQAGTIGAATLAIMRNEQLVQ